MQHDQDAQDFEIAPCYERRNLHTTQDIHAGLQLLLATLKNVTPYKSCCARSEIDPPARAALLAVGPRIVKKRTRVHQETEADIMSQCLDLLERHPKVAFVYRNNVGKFKIHGQWYSFGHKGSADITGMLKGGRRLEVETKKPGESLTVEQEKFIATVNASGGFAVCVESPEGLAAALRGA